MQVFLNGEIQNTVRTRLNLCSRQGGHLERELHKQKNRWSLCIQSIYIPPLLFWVYLGRDFKCEHKLLCLCELYKKNFYFSLYWTSQWKWEGLSDFICNMVPIKLSNRKKVQVDRNFFNYLQVSWHFSIFEVYTSFFFFFFFW